MASLLEPPRNKIIPLEVAGVIIESYDSTLNIVEESSQIYGKALDGKTIVVKYKNGNHYKGEFTNGLLHGQGTFYWTDGVVFTGTFQDNKIIGEGRYDFPDGSFYEGEVLLGLRHGRGIFVTAGEECVYEGEWVSGRKHGQGVMRHKNGTVYEGEFQKGVKHGFGKMVFPSGNYYEGQWANDVKEGQGTMYWVNLNEKYTGSWSQNKQHGWGTHIWLEAKGDGKFLRNRYEGEWRNGMRNGFGVFYYSNGSKYEGEWIDGLKDGFAIFTYEDGRVFKGLYKNDKMIPNVSKDSVLGDIDLNTSQSRPALPPGQSQVDNNNGSLSKQQTLGAVDKVSRKGSRKQTSTPLVPAQDESRELHGNEIGANPYDAMLDITDLLAEEDEDVAEVEIREVKNLLLRYHSSMKAWYRLYTSKQQVNPEESFALSSKMFWKMLRDAKVLSPKVTISSFNRLFMRGSKNTFTLQTSQEELRKNLLIAKREFLDNLSDSDRDTSEVKVDTPEEDEVFLNEIKVDVHDENKVLFFRHFVDALVRVSYLKYGGAPDFAKKIEKVLVKVKNALENKKKSKTQVEEEHFLMRMRGVAEPLKDQIKALFQRFPSKEQTFAFDTIDYTMTIKDIVSIFEQCGIIQDEESRELVLHAAERVNDPEDCCISLPSPNEGNNKEKTVSSKNDLDRMEKLGDLLTSEVIFLEFYDILLIALFRHEPPAVKDEELRRRLAHTLSIMESIGKDTNEEKKDLAGVGPEVNWPYSDKDYMSDHLTTEKEKREMQLAILKQKKLEREHEDRETKTMEREDYDIGDEYLKRPQTKQSYESGEYAESYNDF